MKRLQSVDVMRVMAIIAVIAIHTIPFTPPSAPIGQSFDLATIVNGLARFAVPLFFILSGYFWAKKIEGADMVWAPSLAMGKRIALLFVVWSLIYLIPFDFAEVFADGPAGFLEHLSRSIHTQLGRPVTVFFQGTEQHLWFLMALLWSLGISALLLAMRQRTLLVILAVALFAFGLAGKAYGGTPLGFRTGFNLRNGPFFSLIFFVTGILLASSGKPLPRLRTGLWIASAGIVLQFVELAILHERWGVSMAQDYVLSTFVFGLGAAIIALSNSPRLHMARAAAIGPLVLGIYSAHIIFVELFRPVNAALGGNWLWSIAYVMIVFALSYALARFLSRFSATKQLVM
jgi:surface polysaccharide O-acyltransferase-like enzyme